MADISCDNITIAGVLMQTGSGDSYFSGKLGIGSQSAPDKHLHIRIPDDTLGAGLRISNSDGSISLWNGTGGEDQFVPALRGEIKGSSSSLYVTGNAQSGEDTGTTPLIRLSARVNDGSVSTRPLLAVANVSDDKLTVDAEGRLGIGATAPAARLEVYEGTALGGTAGNHRILARLRGNTASNSFMQNLWLRRAADGSDWNTTRIHDGISIDSSYLTPGSDTRTWWERNPSQGMQAWGDQGNTHLCIAGGNLIATGNVGIGTYSPASTLDVRGPLSVNEDPSTLYGLRVETPVRGITRDVDLYTMHIGSKSPATPVLTLQGQTGRVGIGGTDPTEKLEVDGNVKARGSVSVMGPLDFTAFPAPGAPTAADSGLAGSVDVGTHSWLVTFLSAGEGETTAGSASNVVEVSGTAKQVNLSGIPLGPVGTTGRRIYRTAAGDTGPYKLVDTIPNNTATTYTDDTADAALGAEPPAANTTAVVEIRAGGVPRLVIDKEGNVWVGSRIAIDSDGYPLYG